MTRRTTSHRGIMNTSARKVMTYFATDARTAMTYYT
jgi:hypothetical protein